MAKKPAPIIMIPARMASTRLPGKPLADILGAPMIVHVWRRACEADAGPVVVACAEPEIADAVTAAGGRAVLTSPDLPSGSDRIFAALEAADPDRRFDTVVNLQGDLPTINPVAIHAALKPLANPEVDIATLVALIADAEERDDPNVVKAVVALAPGADTGRALYFSRCPVPWGEGAHYHHIGIYAYRRAALTRFVTLPPGILERRERLEQLRALENGMRIDAALVETVPFGVDTPIDLERARMVLAAQGAGGRSQGTRA
ncbi:MAG: 3-deoxy-manno-octulosonate cytidylyltransferase [Defluviicoccus sp.]|nr:3-deoxy-manno-octulosonate cytidylyltransferase [Defluviicoccus sp.]MDG4592833.1 3-deoxy-manno-octulosonate cytidylyltransferase [Defluviicoccus sp.]MDS4012641.1 3-deoxy-manno-octulosonate cytidylyltransferase [Defluviicoccus sp.]MDS4072302.1 3-deoxy-manno-octulosonate cytidylyltransferase [Defluviicoccus sp.]